MIPKRAPGYARSSTGESSHMGYSTHGPTRPTRPIPVVSSQASSQILKNRFQEACALLKTRDDLNNDGLADLLGVTAAQLRHALSNDLSRPVSQSLVLAAERMANEAGASRWDEDAQMRLGILVAQRWDIDREIEELRALRMGAA